MANSQSPHKLDGADPLPWLEISYCRNGDAKGIQRDLDNSYEQDLSQLVRYTGTNPNRLRAYMDGRILTPRQALRIGLIDDIGYEDAAYRRLLTLTERKEP
jgi:ClpP class serine protease